MPSAMVCMCVRAAIKTASYLICKGTNECLNVYRTACVNYIESYICRDTQQLRQKNSMVDEVVYISKNPGLDLSSTLTHNEEGSEGRQHLL